MNDISGLVTVVACVYEHPFKISVNASRRTDGMREEFSWKMVLDSAGDFKLDYMANSSEGYCSLSLSCSYLIINVCVCPLQFLFQSSVPLECSSHSSNFGFTYRCNTISANHHTTG